ncbi:hypothetical protein [Burkholderia gladioli]|uniref:hypothetical protein n=1 Tax=Burkholderia gladioli TaxID=28095 RepID=UPI00163E098E|nr:hypothetical protein [Burkholderia gladioli]
METNRSGVLYSYRCPDCKIRKTTRRPDDSHDGAAAQCEMCGGTVELEWDGGVTFAVERHEVVPSVEELRAFRLSTLRTQAQTARILGVTERQYQRYEASTESGLSAMPAATWALLKRIGGKRHPADFEPALRTTWNWDSKRDRRRNTIERGDVVELQPVDGPLLRATVCLDRVHDGLVDENSYGAHVSEFVGAIDAGQEYRGFYLGERITFGIGNVLHLEQRVPSPAPSTNPSH